MKQILQNVTSWYNMEKKSCEGNFMNSFQSNIILQKDNKPNQESKKTIYCPIYLQIILLACHFYPNITLSALSGNWISGELLNNWERFHIDYEMNRLLIGIGDLLSFQSLNDKNLISLILNRLPEIIEKVIKIRLG